MLESSRLSAAREAAGATEKETTPKTAEQKLQERQEQLQRQLSVLMPDSTDLINSVDFKKIGIIDLRRLEEIADQLKTEHAELGKDTKVEKALLEDMRATARDILKNAGEGRFPKLQEIKITPDIKQNVLQEIAELALDPQIKDHLARIEPNRLDEKAVRALWILGSRWINQRDIMDNSEHATQQEIDRINEGELMEIIAAALKRTRPEAAGASEMPAVEEQAEAA